MEQVSGKLSDYALIGNSRSSALLNKDGCIEWCCLPEFDSPAIFAALLDKQKGGYFSIHPVDRYRPAQKYIPDTNVVETVFDTEEGQVRLTDSFTAMEEEDKMYSLFPDHEILRIIEGVSGEVVLKMKYVPRIFYGKKVPILDNRGALGIQFVWKENIYTLLSSLTTEQLRISSNKDEAISKFLVRKGEKVIFSLSYSSQSPAILPEVKITGYNRMIRTINFWKNWINSCRYKGLYEDYVRRSALLLKLLAHAPSGAIIAAPTTSLPENVRGERNWDYRYCWLRDSSFTVRALVKLGFEDEAHAYMNWILHAAQLTRPKLQVVYSVFGQASIKEKKLDWLTGFMNSSPVRIGNGAYNQFQLDVYGEVLDAFYTYAPLLKNFDRDRKKFVLDLGEMICKIWEKPDNGIWEVRKTALHHTHSKVMAWVGLNRLIKLCRQFNWKNAPLKKFETEALRIKERVEQYGFNSQLNAYAMDLNQDKLDANVLTFPLVGYCDAGSTRMISTVQAVRKNLSKNNLIYRYRNVDDGVAGDEGSFGICNFWLVENLAKAGKLQQAKKIFDNMLKYSSSTGLFSEEIDPDTHNLMGNYPQGFTHIGLINAAITLNEASQKMQVNAGR